MELTLPTTCGCTAAWLVKRYVREDLAVDQRRWAAAERLKRMGTNAWPVTRSLVNLLRHPNPTVGFAAADVLAAIEADRSPDWNASMKSFAQATNVARAFSPLLGRDAFLRPYSPAHRRFALRGLGAVGSAAAFATPQVRAVLSAKSDHELWPLAIATLAQIGSDASVALDDLRTTLRNPEEWPAISSSAAQALACVKPPAAETLHALREALGDSRSLVRIRAAEALWRLDEPVDELLPVLVRGTTHKLASIRLASVQVLGEIGPRARSAEAAVRALESDPDEVVRNVAIRARGQIAARQR